MIIMVSQAIEGSPWTNQYNGMSEEFWTGKDVSGLTNYNTLAMIKSSTPETVTLIFETGEYGSKWWNPKGILWPRDGIFWPSILSNGIHVWYIYPHLPKKINQRLGHNTILRVMYDKTPHRSCVFTRMMESHTQLWQMKVYRDSSPNMY